MNYSDIKLKVGLEIHQQLDTRHKLFCNCPTLLRDDDPSGIILRELRPTMSELGVIDRAAIFEAKKVRKFEYEYYNDSTCLVELDEEPPHELNDEAIDICLTMSKLLNSQPIDEIHVMRKIVIDGSNTSGFQRTSIISFGGYVSVDNIKCGIQTICLEEDAARKIDEDVKKGIVRYRLDRLGIPLIEIATSPDIKTPHDAQKIALRIGKLLRISGKVKRGLGTIRQDVNISILDGPVIEIKGVQQLELIEKVVEIEAKRQIALLEIQNELKSRNISSKDISRKIYDITDVLKDSKSKIIKRAIKQKAKILAVKLSGFSGILGKEIQPGKRFGKELAYYAGFYGGVKGIFHSDELPNYGITQLEVDNIKKFLKCNENDAFVLVAANKESAEKALNGVLDRAIMAFAGIPEETRKAELDGTTSYLRPRPGSARMYPETDVRPVVITKDRLDRISRNLPELPEEKVKRYVEQFGLNNELAEDLVSSPDFILFEKIISDTNLRPKIIASYILNTFRTLRRNDVNVDIIPYAKIIELLKLLEDGKIAKEALPEITEKIAKDPSIDISSFSSTFTVEDLDRLIKEIISKKHDFIIERGERALSPLMGVVMKEVRGKIDGRIVKEHLKKAIDEVLQ